MPWRSLHSSSSLEACHRLVEKPLASIYLYPFKAFDSAPHQLLKIMQTLSLPRCKLTRFLGSILGRFSSIVIHATGSFSIAFSKSVTQGDPISPYLFNIVLIPIHFFIRDLFPALNFRSVSHLVYMDDFRILTNPSVFNNTDDLIAF